MKKIILKLIIITFIFSIIQSDKINCTPNNNFTSINISSFVSYSCFKFIGLSNILYGLLKTCLTWRTLDHNKPESNSYRKSSSNVLDGLYKIALGLGIIVNKDIKKLTDSWINYTGTLYYK